MEADAAILTFGHFGMIGVSFIALADVLDKFIQVLQRQVGHQVSADGAGAETTHGRVQIPYTDADFSAAVINKLLDFLVSADIRRKQLGRWTDLHRFAFKAWRLAPGILAVVLKVCVFRLGFTFPRVMTTTPLVPGMGNVFRDAVDQCLVLMVGDDTGAFEVAVVDGDTRQGEFGVFGIFRHFRYGQIIGDPFTVFEPLLVGRGDGDHVRIIDLLDKVTGFFHQGAQGGNTFHVDG